MNTDGYGYPRMDTDEYPPPRHPGAGAAGNLTGLGQRQKAEPYQHPLSAGAGDRCGTGVSLHTVSFGAAGRKSITHCLK